MGGATAVDWAHSRQYATHWAFRLFQVYASLACLDFRLRPFDYEFFFLSR